MSDRLAKLPAPVGANTKKTRVGRGVGSGLGKTSGRGQKGQKARSTGLNGKAWFQGGQTPLMRRLPKRGFRQPFQDKVAEVSLDQLDQFDAGATVSESELRVMGFVKGAVDKIKVLATGELTKKLTVKAHAFSKAAKEQIEKHGGTVELVIVHPPKEEAAKA